MKMRSRLVYVYADYKGIVAGCTDGAHPEEDYRN